MSSLSQQQMPPVSVEYRRRRCTTMWVLDDDSVHVFAPHGLFQSTLYEGIYQSLPELRHIAETVPPSERCRRLSLDSVVPLLGKPHVLKIHRGRPNVLIDDTTLHIILPDPSDTRLWLPALRYALKTCLKSVAPSLVDAHCAELQVATPRIRYQAMRKRWGSCRPNGSITLNTWLGGAPIELIDYVVAHEVCHLKEPNHSAAFWSLMKQAVPNYHTHRRWFSQYGNSLIFFGPVG